MGVGSRAHQPETGSEKRSLATRLHCASSLVESAESSPPEPGSSRRLRLQSRAAERGGADPAGWGSHAISALEDPVHARAKIEALFREQMGLGRRPPWIAGQAVPFESDLVERLCDLATRETVERSALASLLASI